jgi:hypothetical protein
MLRRVNKNLLFFRQRFCGDGIYIAYFLYLVSEKLEANREGFIRWIQLDDVAPYPEFTPLKIEIVSRILQVSESVQQIISFDMVACPYRYD